MVRNWKFELHRSRIRDSDRLFQENAPTNVREFFENLIVVQILVAYQTVLLIVQTELRDRQIGQWRLHWLVAASDQ